MRSTFMTLVVTACLSVSGCGGDDTPAKSDPEQKCESFATTWCQKSVDCMVSVGKIPEDQRMEGQTRCTDVAIAAAQCKRAVSVGGSYAQCVSDIQAMDCKLWNVPDDQLSMIQLPSTCLGVVRISS